MQLPPEPSVNVACVTTELAQGNSIRNFCSRQTLRGFVDLPSRGIFSARPMQKPTLLNLYAGLGPLVSVGANESVTFRCLGGKTRGRCIDGAGDGLLSITETHQVGNCK